MSFTWKNRGGFQLESVTGAGPGGPTLTVIATGTNDVKPGEPGCTVGVTKDGSLTHALAFGLADLERSKPLDARSVFNLASVSKQFTAFAILLLEQDGKLKVDDPVVKYLPELGKSAQGVTLAHLMHHTGGLRDYIEVRICHSSGKNLSSSAFAR